MKRFFNLTNLFGTLTIFLTVWIVSNLAISLDFLNVFEQVLGDYNLTDLAFHFKEKPKKDHRIVVVNIGMLSRAEIAQQINFLNEHEPAVIGIDTFFGSAKDSIGDAILADAIRNTKNMILASQLLNDSIHPNGKIVWRKLRKSYDLFSNEVESGFVNVITEGNSDFETWRKEPVNERLHTDDFEMCFGAKIVQLYDSTKTQKLIARKNEFEIINYRGNTEAFMYLDAYDVFNPEMYKPEDIKDKIVIMGYLGDHGNPKEWDEDKYYSPMNTIQVGRTTPDMYGVMGHVNFVAMVLDEDYIDEVHFAGSMVVAFILCFINVALFNYMLHSKIWEPWYDGLSKAIQLLQLILLGYLTYYLFVAQNIKIDLSVAAIVLLFSGDMMELYNGFIITQFKKLKSMKISRS